MTPALEETAVVGLEGVDTGESMIATERYRVLWRVSPHLDLIQMSGLLSGLMALARRRVVSLTTEYTDRFSESPNAAMELVVARSGTGETRRVVWEFYDRADRLAEAELETCDVYFKRQFGPGTRRLPGFSEGRIKPLGLTVPGYTLGSARLFFPAILATLRSREAHRRERGISLLQDVLQESRVWLRMPHPDSARLREEDVKTSGIVFQPRLWANGPIPNADYESANADRVRLVRRLKQAFPKEDAIGLVHNAYAKASAQDLLLSQPVTMAEHRHQLRGATIAVDCAGLSGSVGWKFAEYMAAGVAIVSPPVEMEYPEAIKPEIHYLPYHSPEECVARCQQLLADRDLVERIGRINQAYYRHWIHPTAHALSLLRRAFS